MTNETSQTSVPNGQAPAGTDPQQAQAATSTSQADTSSTPTQSSQPDDVQRQIAELRAENARYRTKAREQEQAAQAAEQQRLAEQGQFKELAAQHEARVKELEPMVQELQELTELVHEQIKMQTKEWPDEVKKLIPDKEFPAKQRLAQVEKLRPLVDKLAGQARTNAPGNRPGPQPIGSAQEKTSDTIRKELIGTGIYKAF